MARFVSITDVQRSQQNDKYLTWDQLAAACVIDADVICETKMVCASVALHSSESSGQMVVDRNRTSGKTDNVCVVTKINQALYEKVITTAFSFYNRSTSLSS